MVGGYTVKVGARSYGGGCGRDGAIGGDVVAVRDSPEKEMDEGDDTARRSGCWRTPMETRGCRRGPQPWCADGRVAGQGRSHNVLGCVGEKER